MGDLKSIMNRDVTGDILPKLFTVQNGRNTGTDTDSLSLSTPRQPQMKHSRSLSEISDLLSKRRGVKSNQSDSGFSEATRRQLAIRLPSVLDDLESTPRDVTFRRKERPMSEFTIPQKWRREEWDVRPINTPVPPTEAKPDKVFKRPYHAFEASDTDTFTRDMSRTTSKGSLASLDLSKYQDTEARSSESSRRKRHSPRRDATRHSKRRHVDQWPMSGRVDGSVTLGQTYPASKFDRSDFKGRYDLSMTTPSFLSQYGLGSSTIDKRTLDRIVRDIVSARESASRAHSDIHTKYSAKYRSTPDLRTRLSANSPFLPKATSEDCLKCLLKIPHKKCESHKYIRVGGGYRHGYWYVKCLLEELELQRQRELVAKQRLEAIKEKQMRAIKTYIRTKSGRLIEKIVFISEEDYELFKAGKGGDILKKYLTKDEAEGLESWDKDEVKAIKTLVRTKSGRLIEKIVYVSKEDYDAITQGKVDAKEILGKYYKPADGETIEGWDEAKMRTIKTMVRTKSGRLVEKIIMISEEDYNKMIKEGVKPEDIIKKYLSLEEGETIEGWESQEAMKAITMKVRTKSGRIIEKTIMVRADEYDRLMAGGADANEILGKYLGEDGGTVEGWKQAEGKPMKVIKTLVRTKSGRLVEKIVMLTEEEYAAFQAAGGDPEFLKKFMKLEAGEKIEDWEKASTVYEDENDPELLMAKEGQRIVGKDGTVYEVVVDPLTGKKYKKKIGQESDIDSGIASMQKGKKGKRGKGGDIEETSDERKARKAGKRDPDSDSDFSYKSYVSAGGTRHVQRRRKRADGTYSDPESYHSDQDPDGAARRRRRRREREHQNSAHSYYSVVSEGGTRHVKRKRRREDGTYSDSESYHSADSLKPGGRLAEKKRKEKEAKEKAEKVAKAAAAAKKGKKKQRGGSGSDYSYTSEYSEGGTRKVTRRKKIKDAQGNVVGYGDEESFSESDESAYTEVSDGKGGKMTVKKQKLTSKQKMEAKVKAKAEAKAKEAINKIKGGKFADVGDFSDSTISDVVDLENMTEEEKEAYFKAKAERKAAREARRREKYGDKYDLMKEKKKTLEKLKKLEEMRAKGMISPSSDWSIDSDTGEPVRKSVKKEAKKQKILQDLREKGLISPSSDWTVDSEGNPVRISELVKQGKRKNKKKDGNEGDDESDESEYDPITGKKIKKAKDRKTTRPGDAGPEGYEYIYDKDGRVIGKKRIDPDGSGSEYEYEYDEDGNVRVKKKEKPPKSFGGEGEFDVGADGKIRLKDGKKKIDLSKLTDDDLRRLGIDPSLSKKEIARLLKEKFGNDITITEGDKVIPVRRASDFGSDADTDELANADDLDPSSLRGIKKVNVMWKKGGKTFEDHMKKIIEQCKLKEDYAKDLDEKDSEIDFLTHYKLVDPGKIESYAKAFVVEDSNDFDTVISCQETKQALEGVPSVQVMTPKQFEYVFKVLKIDDASQVTFRMFAVITALCERVTQMDPLSKYLLEISDLLDIQRKMALYRAMFYCNAESDRNANFIKAESLRIELIAGGLNWKQQEFIMERLQPNAFLEISFLDYLCYVPLFLSMHENIVDNPLDMSDNKYDHNLRKPSGGHRQRDMNPLGSNLRKESVFQLRKQADDLLEGRIDAKDLKPEKVKLLEKISTKPKKKSTRRKSEVAREKKALKEKLKEKLKTMTKEQKEAYRKGKRDPDSDSDYSYRSVVSAGGTRHVMRRRKREDGTYSDEESYHSDQDPDGEARRRLRRRDREHGSDSEHSYYSVISEGGTRHVRRKKRHEDGTYSRSESFRSGMDDDEARLATAGSDGSNGSNGSGDDEDYDDDYGSDVSVHSEYSEGGTRRMVQRQRVRDADGNIVGYGDPAPISDNKLTKLGYPASTLGTKGALEKLQVKRNGELLRETTTDSLSNLRADGEPLVPPDTLWPGEQVAGKEEQLLKEEEDRIPSDFSDATTEDDVDLSKLTPAQRRQYFAEKEKRRKEREKRRREKYGDKYDEIMKKRNAGKNGTGDKPDEKDKLKIPDEARRFSTSRRKSSAASTMSKTGRPKSMVTYDKGPPRDFGPSSKIDKREIGLAHDEWKGKRDIDVHKRNRRGSDASEGSDAPPKLHRETTMIKPLPTIPQGKIYDGDDGKSTRTSRTDKSYKFATDDESDLSGINKQGDKDSSKDGDQPQKNLNDYFEVGKDGKLMLKKKKIDLSKLTREDLEALGIDPNLSAKEIAKRLKSMFGNDIEITLGDEVIGTKGIDEYSDDLNDDQLANDPYLDLDSLTGLRRVNIIMRRGGQALQKHMEKVISLSRLMDKYKKDLDEKGDIDFLNHYRLVEPSKIETYARAFVVEDADLDTVINSHEARIALDGVPSIQHMTSKQMDYVMKVLKIDDATIITFRMFAVITSLCERVTHMDSLSQRLLEICNLADIERKLDLYKAMFYQNVPSERLPNFITTESLKIELIAGGLNWKQQDYIMEKLEPNTWGEISFLDYMCYIPLFLSMHDNICNNPLDMSNQKYMAPPRARPPSVQRDMNPLGSSLTKQSAYWARKKAMEEIHGSVNNASVQVSKKYMDILDKYSSSKYTRLKKIDDARNKMFLREKTRSSSITSSSKTGADLLTW